jgi:hypothetical protein
MALWLVIPKKPGAAARFADAKIHEAPTVGEAAAYFYNQCVVFPVPGIDYSGTPSDGPVAHLPAEGQPQ